MLKTCQFPGCGKTSEMRHNQKYCGSQLDKSTCSYLATIKSDSPLVKCVDCGTEMRRVNASVPRCGKQNQANTCAGIYYLSLPKKKKCGWCKQVLITDDPLRKYHGDQNTAGSCSSKARLHKLKLHNDKMAQKKSNAQPVKSYITCKEALRSGFF